MYKAAVRHLIRRNLRALNAGDLQPVLAMFTDDAELRFPGDNSWASQFRSADLGEATHRGKDEIEAFLRAYVATGMQMDVDDILVNGPPWRARAAVRVHHDATDGDGAVVYRNRAVLFVETRWGKVRVQEDYEDTQRVAAFDLVSPVPAVRSA
jgi:ketosteroid isomerase-like protein